MNNRLFARLLCAALLCLLALSSPVSAQDGVIATTVSDSVSGTPLGSATVEVRSGSNVVWTASSQMPVTRNVFSIAKGFLTSCASIRVVLAIALSSATRACSMK